MDGTDPQQQRNSLNFPYLGHFTDSIALGGGQSTLDVDIDEAWKAFDLQSPQCVNPDHTFDGFRTSHDDLCAYPPKCPTTGMLGSGGNASSHMLFHTRHYNPQTGQQQMQPHSAGGLSFDPFGAASAGSPGLFTGSASTPGATTSHGFNATAGTPFAHGGAGSPATPGAYHRFDHDDFVEQLSALSSPQRPLQEIDDDLESTCDSNCGVGEICHDATCSSDPSACCEDETCLQNPSSTGAEPITSEDAIAAAALTSFVGQDPAQVQQLQQQQSASSSMGHHGHHTHHMSTASSSSGMNLSLGPDLCISPQFLMNYQHIREAHNPLQPTACNASYCPIDDPKFYQECHLRHVMPHGGHGLFDNIDLSMMMANNPIEPAECGAKLPNSEAMIQHFFNEHQASLPYLQPQQQSFNGMMSHVPGLISSAASSVSMSSQDLMRTPSTVTSMEPATLSLRDTSSPLLSPTLLDSSNTLQKSDTTKAGHKLKVDASKKLGNKGQNGQNGQLQKHECYWCNTIGGTPCGHVAESAGDLHQHVLAAHTHQLKRDQGGTYSCGWFGCTRRDGEDKGGFAQKSKIDRHMQVHTGNKPFLCEICHQSFSANQALLQHKLIHEDSKPLSCEICGKTFRQHSALTMHIRTHTKVRPLKCPYCNKEFSESSNLSKHKRIHTGDGLYVCHYPGCGKHFHRKDQLRRHSTQHSKGRLSISSPIDTPSGTPIPE